MTSALLSVWLQRGSAAGDLAKGIRGVDLSCAHAGSVPVPSWVISLPNGKSLLLGGLSNPSPQEAEVEGSIPNLRPA